jgi:hypothetical protein
MVPRVAVFRTQDAALASLPSCGRNLRVLFEPREDIAHKMCRVPASLYYNLKEFLKGQDWNVVNYLIIYIQPNEDFYWDRAKEYWKEVFYHTFHLTCKPTDDLNPRVFWVTPALLKRDSNMKEYYLDMRKYFQLLMGKERRFHVIDLPPRFISEDPPVQFEYLQRALIGVLAVQLNAGMLRFFAAKPKYRGKRQIKKVTKKLNGLSLEQAESIIEPSASGKESDEKDSVFEDITNFVPLTTISETNDEDVKASA